jgi:Domain of unknown function (DUF892)
MDQPGEQTGIIRACFWFNNMSRYEESCSFRFTSISTDRQRPNVSTGTTSQERFMKVPTLLLLNNCGAVNAGALDAAVICTSLDILHYELAKLERLRLYANLLSDRQTVTILNGVLHDSIEAKHRLAELMDLCVDLDSVSAPKSIPFAGGTPAHSAPPVGWLEATN